MAERMPLIKTARCILRPFILDDAEAVQQLAGSPRIAACTLNIPHPYEAGMAERWISTHAAHFFEHRGVTLAVTLADTGELLGTVGYHCEPRHARAELGWWIGVPFWNQGYCTEAARALVAWGFTHWAIRKFTSSHLATNPASGRVMEKLGMQREGLLRAHVMKNQMAHDLVLYGLLPDPALTDPALTDPAP